MFESFGQQRPNQQKPINNSSGCKIKVRRDSSGRISGIETNGRCSKQELEIFKENLSFGESDEEED